MFETYISTRKAAELCQVQTRTIRRNCAEGKFEYKKKKSGRGKIGYLVKLESLPKKAQRRYVSEHSKARFRELKDIEDWRRNIAFERLDTLKKWEAYAKERKAGTSTVIGDFIKDELDGKVTAATLYRWKKAMKEGGVAALAPAWTNGREKFQEDKFSPEAKQWVADFWLHPNRPSMKLGYIKLQEKAKEKGWDIPSYTTVKEFLNEIPETVKIKHREGKKKFESNALPAIERDYTTLEPMQLLECDHHQVDVAVQFPDGRIGFPWLTLWVDVRTRKPVAWALVSRPNSDSINISFREGILKYGLTKEVHLDNGKDFKAKWFTGKKRKAKGEEFEYSINEEYINGLYADLGIKVHWAIPYNAKAKMIERFFKTLRTEWSVFWRSYRGKNVEERPENLPEKWRKRNVVFFEDLKKALHTWMDYTYAEKRKHRGDGMENRTPNQVFFGMMKKKRAVREEELVLLCSREPQAKTVHKNGIWLFNSWYWNSNVQANYLGRKVMVRYTEEDISKLYVFTPEGKYIGVAQRKDKGFWGMNEKEYEKQMRFKKSVRESTKDWEKEHIPVRMSESEREALVQDDEAENFKEPELEANYVYTKYADIVAAEELEKEKDEEIKKAKNNFNNIQATFFEDFDNLQKEEADDYILEFGRFE